MSHTDAKLCKANVVLCVEAVEVFRHFVILLRTMFEVQDIPL